MSRKRRRPSASPVCSAAEAPHLYMLARPLDGDELDGLLTALRRVEERLGDPARLALIDRHLSGRTAAPIETVATAAAAAMLIGRMLPLVADEEVRADLEALRRSYVGS